MRHAFSKTVIIALGGSIVFPDQIDWDFLRRFRSFVLREIKKGRRFVIVSGGGRLSRIYQEAAGKVVKVTNEDKDWLGIHATRSNAHLLRTIFREEADPVVLDERHKIRKLSHPITIASGWRPGWSTDFIAVALAQDFNVPEAVIAGKPSHVYDKDFAKFPDAKPFTELTWSAYRKLVPAKWVPGAHAPVDPVAARLAEEADITAIVVNGKDLKNFGNLLSGRNFEGTVVEAHQTKESRLRTYEADRTTKTKRRQ